MDQLIGYYDIAGSSGRDRSSSSARPSVAPGSPCDDSPSLSVVLDAAGMSGLLGERGGTVVVDRTARTARPEATATSSDGRFTLSLLGASSGDAAARAEQTIAAAPCRTDALPYERLGAACETLREVVGAGFLCALRDDRDGTLAVLRSRDCPWPLFHLMDRGRLWFGSHLPSLRGTSSVPLGVDGSAVAFFLAYGFPPLDRSLLTSVARLGPDMVLSAGPDGSRIDRLPDGSSRVTAREGTDLLSALRSAIGEDIATAVAGKTVGLLGPPGDPRIALLGEAAMRAGAARVVAIEDRIPTWAERVRYVERIAEAEGEVFAAPGLASLVSGAERAAREADLCLVPEGSTLLAGTARRHAGFADRLAENRSMLASATARSQAFHNDRLFVRDHYFQELAVFDDAARLAVSGPASAPWNVFAMSDELGPDLETADSATAAECAARRDSEFLVAGLMMPLVGAVSRLCGVPIHAPCLSSKVGRFVASMQTRERDGLRERTADWPRVDLAEIGGDGGGNAVPDPVALDLLRAPSFGARGLIGRAALEQMLQCDAPDGTVAGARLWTLCCLEIWYRRAMDAAP